MKRDEKRRHKLLWSQVKEQVQDTDAYTLKKSRTTYSEEGAPSPFGRVAFSVSGSSPVKIETMQDRATIHAEDRAPGDWIVARLDFRDGYRIGCFVPRPEDDQLFDLPDPVDRVTATEAASYLLNEAEEAVNTES